MVGCGKLIQEGWDLYAILGGGEAYHNSAWDKGDSRNFTCGEKFGFKANLTWVCKGCLVKAGLEW